jgi:hypothetical protein
VLSGISLTNSYVFRYTKFPHTSFFRHAIPLVNHIATLNDFLGALDIVTGQPDQQVASSRLFQNMTYYLVSSSWRKMKRRMHHWSSNGFLFSLSYSDGQRVQDAFRNYSNSKPHTPANYRKDETLAKLFITLGEQRIQRIMQNYPSGQGSTPVPSPTSLPNLSEAFKEILREGSPQTTVYTLETCVEFHQFLVALLFTYSKALLQLSEVRKPKSDALDSEVRAAFEDLWNLSNLLWRVAYSRILRHHLTVLHHGGLLNVPVGTSRSTYEAFINLKLVPSGVSSSSSDKEPQEPDDSSSGGEQEDEDVSHLDVDTQHGDVVTVFLRWIRLHVTQFVALHIVSSFFQKHPKPLIARPHIFDTSLLAVRPPSHTIDSWEATIQNLASTVTLECKFDAAAVIQHIKDQAGMRTASLYGISCPILPKFQASTFVHVAAVHCEAALAAAAKYPTLAIKAGGDEVSELLQVLYSVIYFLSIHLTPYAAARHEVDFGFEVMLSCVLGSVGDLERR